MEDMCQLTERLTEEKYNGSYEQIGNAILKHSSYPGLDVVNFCELVLFSFLTGNADMHLKNFSLNYQTGTGIGLAPAYDLLATALVNPADEEDMALTLNGKKKKINLNDFKSAFKTLHLDDKQQDNIFKKMEKSKLQWMELIGNGFLTGEFRDRYRGLLESRFKRLS
jgi:serine/threonine-protein kinase HipA